MKMYLLGAALIAVAASLAGCDPTPEQIRTAAINTAENAANPQTIASLPDGRKVKRIEVDVAGGYDHYVYFVDGAEVTTNYDQQHGKTTFNQVTVSLPKNPTAEQVIAVAERVRAELEAAERAELKRLEEKYGK